MQLAGVVVTSVGFAVAVGGVRGRNGEFGVDLVEGFLGAGKAKLALEQGRLGRVLVGVGEVEALGRVDELLGLLHQAGQVQHDGPADRSAGHIGSVVQTKDRGTESV